MTGMSKYSGRVGLQQRVLPAYRAAFFDRLAAACTGGLSVFAGLPLPEEHVATTDKLTAAHYRKAQNRNIFPITSALYQCWQSGILRWLDEWQPHVLILEANARYPSSRLAVRWMHARGRPVLGWGLGEPPLTGPLAGLRRWNRLTFLRSLDGVIAYSQRGAAEYRALGFPPERVFVAPNAAAPRPTGPPPERPRKEPGEVLLLFVGRLQQRKRLDNLFYACAELPQGLQPAVTIVGDGPARAEFEELAARVYPRARFLGELHGPPLEACFRQADLFVLPGTGGLAVQQAMSQALPVIVAQGDGTQDDLVRPENGWRVAPGDRTALRAALEEALSDLDRLRRMGQESYRIVVEEVNLEAMVDAFVCALNQISTMYA